jgi:hypothetical protein
MRSQGALALAQGRLLDSGGPEWMSFAVFGCIFISFS